MSDKKLLPTFEEDFAEMVKDELEQRKGEKESLTADMITVKGKRRNIYSLALDFSPFRLIKEYLKMDDADYVLFACEAWGTNDKEAQIRAGGIIANMPAELRFETLIFAGLARDGKKLLASYRITRDDKGRAKEFKKEEHATAENARSPYL